MRGGALGGFDRECIPQLDKPNRVRTGRTTAVQEDDDEIRQAMPCSMLPDRGISGSMRGRQGSYTEPTNALAVDQGIGASLRHVAGAIE